MQRSVVNAYLGALILAAANAPAAVISNIYQINTVYYTQTSALQPDPSSAKYQLEGVLVMQNAGDFTAANLVLPGGLQPTNGINNGVNPDMIIPPISPIEFYYSSPPISQAAYTAEFLNGIYTYTATGSPSQTVTIDQTAPPFATSIPFITDFTSLQGMNSANPLTVTWDSFGGALSGNCLPTCSFVSLDFFHNALSVFSTGSLSSSTTSANIPANTFAPNTAYDFRLTFENWQSSSTVTGSTASPPKFLTYALDSGTITTAPATAVPEPSSLLLSVLGLLILAAYRLRTRMYTLLLTVALSAPAALADAIDQINYTIHFTGTGLLPSSGSFTWDPDTSRFTAFSVTWDSITYDLTYFGPNYLGIGSPIAFTPPCIGGVTGPLAAYALMTGACSPAPPGYFTIWKGSAGGLSTIFGFATAGLPPNNSQGIELGGSVIDSPPNTPAADGQGEWTVTADAAPVPEPSSLLLAAVSLCLLATRTRIPRPSRRPAPSSVTAVRA
jgi:hypothetical protein